MKIPKTVIAAIGSLALVGSATAQSMVAGWDFSQFAQDGFSTLDGSTVTGDIDANYTGTSANFSGGAAVGSLHYDSNFGSSAISLFSPSHVEPQGFADMSVGSRGFMGFGGSLTALGTQGQTNTAGRALGFNSGADTQSFVIAIDLGSLTGSGWSLQFGGSNTSDPNNSSSIAWDWSTDGSSFTSSGITSNLGSSDALQTVDLSSVSALDGVSTAFFRGTLGGLDGGLTFIDNVAVDSTVVPEPSIFAALAGALALSIVGLRRRRR